ncbi:hypothetical protein AAW14_13140 [Streptomyces hygroscopicus]|uniref:hypothetical protein n=1 Tax=Streptomyces hygroscopicus TaxID=1912 RepID=UPI00223EA4EE|nr:hypothetical protein [Streptomyces hygroscopicus]MCW7942965.1 hypothetical protein [Streptomyces hygroscopicus]
MYISFLVHDASGSGGTNRATYHPAPAPGLVPTHGPAERMATAGRLGVSSVGAVRCVPSVVSTDCPHGPLGTIRSGADGRSAGAGDAVAAGLLDIADGEALRRRTAAAAPEDSARLRPARIAERHRCLCAGTVPRGGRLRGGRRRTGAALPGGAQAVREAGRGARAKGHLA